MKIGVPYLALGIGLLTGTLFAFGQTPHPMLVAQAPASVPPSGLLITQPPAPVAVPPSGVLEIPPDGSCSPPLPPRRSRQRKTCKVLKGPRP